MFLGWAIFHTPLEDGKTAFQMFMDKQRSSIRAQTKEILDRWVTVPGMYEVTDHIDETHFRVESLDTAEPIVVGFEKEALELYPNSPDAYVILAEEAGSLEEQNDRYFDGMINGEAEFGPTFFEKTKGISGVSSRRVRISGNAGTKPDG
ncbi:hypothetical protein [Salicibibacter kimchii]|uniref:Uncharacterized protein n=1 Tax=Salicibibacter kimchii TaxID=2099786 RepID=A0A345BWA3_9BACI|nr:hypothetical protein [Salicibibacter kimchii]AXF55234.1 hypothetical protein DT065_03830 [Salicibibacter kimchii]